MSYDILENSVARDGLKGSPMPAAWRPHFLGWCTRPFTTQPLSPLQHHSLNQSCSCFTSLFLRMLFPPPRRHCCHLRGAKMLLILKPQTPVPSLPWCIQAASASFSVQLLSLSPLSSCSFSSVQLLSFSSVQLLSALTVALTLLCSNNLCLPSSLDCELKGRPFYCSSLYP